MTRRSSQRRGRLPLLVALVLTACFDRSYPAELPCAENGSCPPGQECGGDGLCRADPIDASPGDAACSPQTVVVTTEADGFFAGPGAGADQPKGTFDIANIGTGISSQGLFRFDLAAVPPAAEFVSGTLLLTPAPRSSDCGSDCATCDHIESDGAMTLHFMRSDWDEATFTYFERQAGDSWSQTGAADVGEDRSDSIANASHSAGQPLSLQFDDASIASWRAGNKLSLLVAPSMGGIIVAATRETGQCPGSYTEPTLTVRYCP